MKVDLLYVLVETPDGEVVAGECSVCHERFFDEIVDGTMVRSGVEKFIGHANDVHYSTGGIIGGGKERRSACA